MFERLDFDEFHRTQVPARLAAGNGKLAAHAVHEPIAFRLPDGRAWTFVPVEGDIEVRPGDDAATVVELDGDAWSDFVQEAHTSFGLLYAGALRFPRGDFGGLDRWEPALRAVFHGRPLYDPSDLADIELARTFTLDDDPADLGTFLHTTGFLHVRDVFAAAEIATVSDEVERLRRRATLDDRRSWWAKNEAGDDVCCRLIYTSLESARLGRLAGDDRLHRLAALAATPLIPVVDRLDGVSVVIKHPAVVEGLSDLPWHRDCGLGGHPVLCPTLNMGIQLDAADADNGQLHFLAGSHLSSCAPPGADVESLPVLAVDTRPGDVTVHFGHVLHAAPPPRSATAGRRALYVGFVSPELFGVIGPGQGYNDVLFTASTDG
ncbi:MAG: hypothetical protein JWO68_16, partial [Actinomycetia bacterium]|nr:hypothetical protein [Actinomycetes bacterium]